MGTLWSESTNANCADCPPGFSCAVGTNDATQPKILCPRGYYCPLNTDPASIPACPGGTYSYYIGLEADTECTDCPEGFACPQVSLRPIPCKRGYFCPRNSSADNANPCPAGTYSNKDNLSNASECTPCPKGYFCGSAAIKPTACAAGSYRKDYKGTA